MTQEDSKLRIGVIGGGVGELTAALAFRRCGFEVKVFERSRRDWEIGAGVGLGPNAVKVFRALGLEQAVLSRGFEAEESLDAIVARTTRIQSAARTQPRFIHHTDQAAELNSDWLYGYDATQT